MLSGILGGWTPAGKDQQLIQTWDTQFPNNKGDMRKTLQAENKHYVREKSDELFSMGFPLANLCVRIYRLTVGSSSSAMHANFLLNREILACNVLKAEHKVEIGDMVSQNMIPVMKEVVRLYKDTSNESHTIIENIMSRTGSWEASVDKKQPDNRTENKKGWAADQAKNQRPREVIAGAAILAGTAWATCRYVIPMLIAKKTK